MIVANLNPGTYYAVVRYGSPMGTGEFGISLQADIPDDSIEITLDAPAVQASIGQGGEEDRYRFNVPDLGRYVIETQGPTDVVMSLYGPDSSQNFITEDDDGGQDRNARINSRLSAGKYLVRVRHYFPTGTGLYSILARTEAKEAPARIEVNGPEVQGEIGIANESDLYQFMVTQQGRYIIETSGTTDTFLTLSGPDDATAIIARDDDSGPGLLSRIEQALTPGTYYARVRHFSPSETGPYGIRVRSA
jgi:tyrosinase